MNQHNSTIFVINAIIMMDKNSLSFVDNHR